MEYHPPATGFRTFLIVLSTQGISVFGNAIMYFATTVWLTTVMYARPEQQSELALALSAISLAFAIPAIVVAPIAGAWVDRHDRKKTMVLMGFAAGILSLAYAGLLLSGAVRLWNLLVVLALSASIGQFHTAALDTSYAMLVPSELLARANGMMQTVFSLTGVLAPGVAAGIVSLPALARQGRLPAEISGVLRGLSNGTPLAIIADSLTFFIAAVALLFLHIPSPTRADLNAGDVRAKNMWADVKEGAAYIITRRPLLWLLCTFTAINFAVTPVGVFTPLILKFRLAPDWSARGMTFEMAIALVSTVNALGGLAGGFIISAWGGLRKRRVYGILVPLVAAGAAQIAFGLSANLLLTAGAAAVMTSMIPIANAHSQAIWQTQTPRELQGRVFSVRRVIAQFSWPLSTAMAGWVASRLSPGPVMAALGLMAAAVALVQVFNPTLMRVDDKDWLERTTVGRAHGTR